MAEQSIILGTIDGISQPDYERLKNDLFDYFDQVGWKNNTLFINSSKKHDSIKGIAKKIANCIEIGKFGSLLFIGNNRVVCIFFGTKRFVAKHYIEPEPPDWWGDQSLRKSLVDKPGGNFFKTIKKMKF